MQPAFIWRGVACLVLFILPFCFPHDPWKPEETLLVGQILYLIDHKSALTFSAHTLFAHIIAFCASFIPLPLEVMARILSAGVMIAGGFVLHIWSKIFQRAYPELLPTSLRASVWLLPVSALGVMVWGYQATSESAWFLGTALSIWSGAELQRIRRYAVGATAVVWLTMCGGLSGMLLGVSCAGVLPWLWRWIKGERDSANAWEGLFLACASLFLLMLLGEQDQAVHVATMYEYLKRVIRVLLWYALPIWPLVIAVWWRGRQLPERIRLAWLSWRWLPVMQLGIALLLGARMNHGVWQESHVLMYLPFFVAMGLPALYLVDVRSWFNAVHWFTRSVLILVLAAIWLIVSALTWHLPFRLFAWLERYQPGFSADKISLAAWGFSIVLSIFALRYLLVPCKTLRDSLWRWTLGFGCTACVIRLMIVPYIDYGRTYQETFKRINHIIPASACVTIGDSVGDSQRAMWRYYTGRAYSFKSDSCRWRLEQFYPHSRENSLNTPWRRVVQDHRPGDEKERFVLWQR